MTLQHIGKTKESFEHHETATIESKMRSVFMRILALFYHTTGNKALSKKSDGTA